MTMAKVPHQKSNDPSNIYVPTRSSRDTGTMSIKAMKVLNAKKTFTPKQTRCVRHKTKGCTSVLCR